MNSVNSFMGFCLLILMALTSLQAAPEYFPSTAAPPPPPREFRGAWVATVHNLDWPSSPGLPVATQKAQLLAILDKAVQLRLNAIIFQVRPACDAFYASSFEPWSPFLTGVMGRAPSPAYDPLAFVVQEAHQRGLELHAWFNPFRAVASQAFPLSAGHVSKTNPAWVKSYTTLKWLDPGNPEVRDYSLKIIMDVVKRYDIDAVHLDDYFYPYPVKKDGKFLAFPDSATARAYNTSGLDLAAWRRSCIDEFVKRLSWGIKANKPWVRLGISPFGIWRPGVPAGTTAGLDAFNDLCADSRKWFQSGWLDYFSPQLYWSIGSKEQSYTLLVKWWASQNTASRHFWPGIATERVGPDRPAGEMPAQIKLARAMPGSDGHIHWNMKPLMQNKKGVAELLRTGVYAELAIPPESPWLGAAKPPAPLLTARPSGDGVQLSWASGAAAPPVARWLLQVRRGGSWQSRVVDGKQMHLSYGAADAPEAFAVSQIGRAGQLGAPATLQRK